MSLLFGDQGTSSRKKKNTNNATEVDTVVSDGPDHAFDPQGL